jgi:archaetidylinositol phosphate synthase
MHVHPNVITWMALPFAVLAAALYWKSTPETAAENYYLIWAGISVSIMGVLDLLDGRIARLTGKATLSGDFLDHVMDRWLDVVLLTAIAFSPWADMRVGLFAIAGTLLTSYMGTQAQAVGAGRIYGGFLTRADRVVLLIAAPYIDHVLVATGTEIPLPGPGAQYALGLLLWYFAVMGIFTSLQRFVRIYAVLRRKERKAPPAEPSEDEAD